MSMTDENKNGKKKTNSKPLDGWEHKSMTWVGQNQYQMTITNS